MEKVKIKYLAAKGFVQELTFDEFITHFETWSDLDKKVFKNRAKTQRVIMLGLKEYEFSHIDYVRFKMKYRL